METPHAGPDAPTETSTTAAQETPSGDVSRRVPGLVIVAHPDLGRVGEEAPLAALVTGGSAELSRHEPRFLPPGLDVAPRPLGDSHLSRRPLRLSPGPEPGSIILRRGDSPIAVKVCGEPIEGRRTFSANEIERGVTMVLAGRIALLLQRVSLTPPPSGPDFGLVGSSWAMSKVRREIQAAALLDVPILLRGETGTGKELVARAVYDARLRGGPYLTVNLGALVPALAASELFGATRGAYTGADRRREGFFRRAAGGTLFLDEIGEAPIEVQVMLLRTLESGRVQAVGGAAEKAVDVRVIAATDADLEAAIDAGRFRSALLHRLAGYEIHVPPLRARRDDIARLFVHFLDAEARALGGSARGESSDPWPSAAVMERLANHRWPGNVRELKNVARRLAVLRHVDGAVDPGQLLDQLLRPAGGGSAEPPPDHVEPSSARRRGADIAPDELLEALERHRWRPGPAARALRLSRPTLYRLIAAHPDLRTASDLGEAEIHDALDRHGSVAAAAEALRISPQGLKRRMSALGIEPPSD